MRSTGLCDICGKPDVNHVCHRCGALVCDRHFDSRFGMCVECVGEVDRTDESSENQPDDDTYRY